MSTRAFQWSDDFSKLVVWNKLRKIRWTKSELDVVEWVLEIFLNKTNDSRFMEDNPSFLTDYNTQMFFLMILLLSLPFGKHLDQCGMIRLAGKIIKKLVKNRAIPTGVVEKLIEVWFGEKKGWEEVTSHLKRKKERR
jgi:hypothetical protein